MNALLAVDLRNEVTAEKIVVDAGAWASKLGAKITLLYTDELRASSPEVADLGLHDEFRSEWERIQREDEVSLARLLAVLPEPVRGGVRIVTGKTAAEAIVEEAGNADVVLMATHGRTGLAHWWVGSCAEQVVRTCPKPVLVLRAPV
jgi:nucleotide-binding universal stress UspA family protein